jgi:flagellar basal body-associated protein FliL
LAKSKPRARDLKKQRWAGIIAGILALAMVVSLVGVYLSQAFMGNRQAELPAQPAEQQPEDYLAYYQQQIDNLELYLEENEPTEAVLLELADNYRYLVYIRQMFFDNQEELATAESNLTEVYRSLIELKPDNPQYRLELINFQLLNDQDELAAEQIAVLLGQLHQQPDPLYHLSLVGMLNSIKETKPELGGLAAEEIQWLQVYFEEMQEDGTLSGQDRFYYAVLLGEYLDQQEAAEELLALILEQEDEESKVYKDALSYRDYLQPAVDETTEPAGQPEPESEELPVE